VLAAPLRRLWALGNAPRLIGSGEYPGQGAG